MNPESLKQILEALNNATGQARAGFEMYLAYQLLDTIVVAFTIAFLVVFAIRNIIKVMYSTDVAVAFFDQCYELVKGRPHHGSRVWSSETGEVFCKLKAHYKPDDAK